MVDFTRYEYQDLVDRMTEKLKNADGWGDGYDSSMGQVLIQLVADTTDQLHYMLERRTTESYLYTARTRSAVIAKASERGYHYRRVLGNRGFLELKTNTVATSNIIIPKFTTFSYEDISYVSTEQVFIPTGSDTVQIPVVQGTLIQKIILQSELDASGDFIIESGFDNIDDLAFSLEANGFDLPPVWKTTKRAMSFLKDSDNFYDVRYGFDGMRIIFGDGKFGRRPTGDINLKYVRIDNLDEPLTTIGREFTFEFIPTDVNNNTYSAVVTNTTRIHNGNPVEDIESIRRNATIEHNTSNRAVTPEDTVYWINQSGIGDIIDVNVTGEQETPSYVYNTNNIYINYTKTNGQELTPQNKTDLRNYLKTLSITNPHYVFQKAAEIFIAVSLSVKKDKLVDISVADFYQILKDFLEDYFAIKKGSIGARYEHTDLIRDLYKLETERNNIVYKLVDFLRLELDLLYPIDVPVLNKEVLVKLAPDTPKVSGSSFALNVGGFQLFSTIFQSDSNIDILQRMRDIIFSQTPYLAEVIVGEQIGSFQEAFNNTIGGGLMIGVNVPMNRNTQMMGNFVIGSNIATVLTDSPAFSITHNYNAGLSGRRNIIPLAIGSTVTFTAPADTNIRILTRTNLNDPNSESLYFVVSAGNQFVETFDDIHSIQIEYENVSSFPFSITFNYPLFNSATSTGLRIYTRDGYGTFFISKEGGDIEQFVTVLQNRVVPVLSNNIGVKILPENMTIVDSNNNTLYRGTRAGTLISSTNVASIDGRVDYINGLITIPSELPNGQYFVKFKQDKYQNISLDSRTIGIMMPISDNISTPNPFSNIEVI